MSSGGFDQVGYTSTETLALSMLSINACMQHEPCCQVLFSCHLLLAMSERPPLPPLKIVTIISYVVIIIAVVIAALSLYISLLKIALI